MTNKPLTASQRVKRSNQRKRDAGLINPRVWMHPDDAGKVRAYAAKQPKTKAILKSLKDSLSEFWDNIKTPGQRMD